MKSYTDIEQSKKLAEILPLESADMIYRPIMEIDSVSNSGFLDTPDCLDYLVENIENKIKLENHKKVKSKSIFR